MNKYISVAQRKQSKTKFYKTMYLDGYQPYEIMQSLRDKMKEDYVNQPEDEEKEEPTNLNVKVEVKKK